ncbi:MAG: FkbM family methyltransferase [Rhodospirillales bacterium]
MFEAISYSGYGGLLISRDGEVSFVHDSRDRGPGRELFIRGTQDFAKLEIALGLLHDAGRPPIDRLLDIGANIGTICIPAVRRGLIASAIGVEAVPAIAQLFAANLALNGVADKIGVVNAAVSAQAGDIVEIALNATNQGDNRVATARAAEDAAQFTGIVRVATTTIDDLLPDGAETTLIWMDIQGHEGIALTGGKRSLAATPPLVLEFCPLLMQQADSYDALKTALAGYRGFHDLGHPGDLRGLAELDTLYATLGLRGNFTDIIVL